MQGRRENSIDLAQQLRLQDELALLVLLTRFVRLVVLPPHCLLALLADDVAHLVPARCHVPLHGFGLRGVDDGVEEEGFAVLAAEVLGMGCVRAALAMVEIQGLKGGEQGKEMEVDRTRREQGERSGNRYYVEDAHRS